MIKRVCDACSGVIDKGTMYVKVSVIGESGIDSVFDSHFACLNSDNLMKWLALSYVGKVELEWMNEGDDL